MFEDRQEPSVNEINTFVHRLNLERFKKLIDETKDAPMLEQLFKLLAEEHAKDLHPIGED
jgi:hypothetical protein